MAQQRTRGTVFKGLTEREIKARVRSAWRHRQRLLAQTDPATGTTRVKYRGVDPKSGQIVEFWHNQSSGIVETAYPTG